jgi:hypothetical protein
LALAAFSTYCFSRLTDRNIQAAHDQVPDSAS